MVALLSWARWGAEKQRRIDGGLVRQTEAAAEQRVAAAA
jgi:hypothetical protein